MRWLLIAAGIAGIAAAPGCGEEQPTPLTPLPQEKIVLTPDAPPLPGEAKCEVVQETGIDIDPALHVEVCTDVKYTTNPPSGGNHWPEWAAYRKYSVVVPREMYVHDLEHGAVVLAYRCADACPEVVAALEEVFDNAAGDPLCLSAGAGIKARLVLTPDPELATPIAAAAWGATYTATCIDKPSLTEFVAKVYGRGTEATCFNGTDIEAAGPPDCSAP